MQVTILGVEIVGHLALIITFIIAVVYTARNRSKLKRQVRSSRVVYWLILSMAGFFALVGTIRLVYLLTSGVSTGMSPLMDLLAEYPSVVAQSLIILFLITNRIEMEKENCPRTILAIGAHPDDIEIAAGATLARMRDAGHRAYGLVMTQGEMGGNSSVRPSEAQRGAGFLGLEDVTVKGFNDTRLGEQPNDLVQAIEEQIRRLHPDIILTHSSHDVHQDHQAVHQATLRAGRNQGTILCYESPSVTQEFLPTFFVDVGKYGEVKVEAVRSHWDQRKKPYMQAEQILGKLAFRGGQAKVRLAEGFEVIRMVSSQIGDF